MMGANVVDNSWCFSRDGHDVTPLALVVLNSDDATDALVGIWQRASFKVLADGGANRVYDAAQRADPSGALAKRLVPNAIAGDWDSVRPEVADFYRALGASLERDDGQDDNDLWKSLRLVRREQDTLGVKVRC